MFKLIGWGIAYPLLAISVGTMTWFFLSLRFEDSTSSLLGMIGTVSFGASFIALAVGYMLRDSAHATSS